MNQVLLSVLIPAYNASSTLKYCLNSIIDSYEVVQDNDMEIICIDDGSKDDTWKILLEYSEKYSYINVYHKENEGVGPARNEALKYARGEYIGWVDSDDYVAVDWYKCISRSLRLNHPDCLLIDYNIKHGERIERKNIRLPEHITTQQFIYELSYERELKSYLYCEFIRSDLWQGTRFPSLNMQEDVSVITELIIRYRRIYHVRKNLYYYVMNDKSITHNVTYDMIWSNIHILKKRYEKFKKMGFSYRLNSYVSELVSYWYYPGTLRDKKLIDRRKQIRAEVRRLWKDILKDSSINLKTKIKLFCINRGCSMPLILFIKYMKAFKKI